MAKNILFEVTPVDLSTGLPVTLRMSMSGGGSSSVLVNNLQWLPVMESGPARSLNIFSSGEVQEIDLNHGTVTFRLHPQFQNTHWANYSWYGALARAWVGDHGAPWGSYTQFYEGQCGYVSRDGAIMNVPLDGPNLDTDYLTATYGGTGGADGMATMKGVLKPRCFGECKAIDAVLIDPLKWVFQYDGYNPTEDVVMVYENAYPINATPKGTYSTYAELAAATLVEGEWAKAPAVGMFRLGGQPNGRISAHVKGAKASGTYVDTIATIVPEILKVAAISAAKIDQTSFNTFSGMVWKSYVTSQITVGELARDALRQCGGYLFPSSTGQFKVGNFYATKSAVALKQDRTSSPLVRSVKQLPSSPPNWQVKVGYDHCDAVHSDSEISSALFDAAAGMDAAEAAATAAQEAAELAQAAADNATNQITAFVSDNVLDRSEKANVVREFERIVAEKTGINNTASQLGIVTENTAYNNAYNALNTYLTGLSPAYNDYTQHTTIVGSTFRQTFNDFYAARQTLLNKAAQLASFTVYLSNDAIVLPANSIAAGGAVTSYLGASGKFIVKQGNTDITEQCTFSNQGTTGTGLTVTGPSNVAGSRGSYSITGGWTENTPATFLMRATYGSQVFEKLCTITKAFAGSQGIDGQQGATTAQVTIYKRSAGTPVKPTVATTYTFAGGGMSPALDNGWQNTPPANNGQDLYTCVATVSSTGTTVSIPAASWSSPALFAVNGTVGSNGYNTATVSLYQRSASGAPANPSVTTNYTFANAVLSGVNNGWSQTIPTGSDPLYVTMATARSQNAAVDIVTTDWTAPPRLMSQNGTNGRSSVPYYSASSSPPSGMQDGDIWYQTDTKKFFIYKNSAWTPMLGGLASVDSVSAANISGQLTDAQISALAATKLTGSITTTQIGNDQITTPKIATGQIVAGHIAADQITASKLAILSLDNVLPDAQFQDLNWWTFGNQSGFGQNLTSFTGSGSPWWAPNTLTFSPGNRDFYSEYFPVELGGTYKISMQLSTSSNFSGWFRPVLHMPNNIWFNFKTGGSISDPSVNDATAYQSANVYDDVNSGKGWTYTNPASGILNNSNRQWQFRFTGNITAGQAFMCFKIVRVSDGTLIKDGAITTAKIEAGAITAGTISANAIGATHIAAGAITSTHLTSNTVSAMYANIGTFSSGVAGQNRLVISGSLLGVYDAANNPRVRLGLW